MPRARLDPSGPYGRHPLQPHQLHDRFTPTEHAIVLCHLGVPRMEREQWSLSIDGLVRHPRRLGFGELTKRPSVAISSVHECCGSPTDPETPTRRVCNVTWRGVRLSDLVAECDPAPAARFLWSSGGDYGAFNGVECDSYLKDLPLERLGADVLIAFEMNGAPLRPEHGYPARLVVPGYYGTNSVKWLNRLTLAQTRATGPFTTRWYNDPVRDGSGQPTGQSIPVWAIAPESVIVSPAPAETIAMGMPTEVWGWAWGDGGIASVDLSYDGGGRWWPAAVEPPAGRQWQRFSAPWRPDRYGDFELVANAHSTDGRGQPASGARNAMHRVSIRIA